MVRPQLVTVAHGTRHGPGNRVARSLTAQAARRLGGIPGVTSYVELSLPSFASVMATSEAPSLVVPLLLSAGYHTRVDLPEAVAMSRRPVRITRPLGPHPLLAEVMARRLIAAGARIDDPVVMVAAGSRDEAAGVDLDAAVRLLRARWGGPVTLATVSGRGLPVGEAVAQAREHTRTPSRVAVAPYLLAAGHFSQRVTYLARSHGVEVVGDVLGPHPLVAELVARRYRAALTAHTRLAA
ncbi:sirohydrochlorin chelatase [Nocardioides sp.]|uniref:sirohydrochlorin chelatase n=1 Tax=Nocardioides sp. TaxID=35761 RepID=UPI002734B11B|nr:sirohydrochlorin chelatase [Nocardioides sp.]MDP3889591.1 sirohydrochlorin chelatase [Nocardioides sp.]